MSHVMNSFQEHLFMDQLKGIEEGVETINFENENVIPPSQPIQSQILSYLNELGLKEI